MFNEFNNLWVEKYRPKTLDKLIASDYIKDKLKEYIDNKEIPNLLLYGTAGTGKSTIAKILINNIECEYLYINASDENNVETMRTKIKQFVSTNSIGIGLKIVLLEEADALTLSSQEILRRLMEDFYLTSRFIITCNYKEKLIAPLISRCHEFEIVPPSQKEVALKALEILKDNNVEYNPTELGKLIQDSYPDIRKVIQSIQQNIVDNKLKINSTSTSEYMNKLFEILLQQKNKRILFQETRQFILDNRLRRFEHVYKFFFDNIDKFNSARIGNIIKKEFVHMFKSS